MKKFPVIIATLLTAVTLLPASLAADADANVKSSTVFIVSYDRDNTVLGRGSGFFVDDGIVITNIHVVDEAYSYRVFIAGDDGEVNPKCYKDIERGDIKLNLEDDVAYLRVFINCPHGFVTFADRDPRRGEDIGIYGFPVKGSTFSSSFALVYTPGEVTDIVRGGLQGEKDDWWIRTNAKVYAGNSGGPVVMEGSVVGIVVAARMTEEGETVDSVFIPVSQIVRGLEYANDSAFGYTPRPRKHLPEPAPVVTVPLPVQPPAPPASSSSSSSGPKPGSFEDRVCKRVVRSYSNTATIWKRVNERIRKRFGFMCTK